ncbi:4-fold beta flower protein [Bradyrhizobium diazoefficiens]|uniref:4-fold beta flower protein n=1 Tax=Bradyrhizobium diazoefficiens TaxID=1355477 RepID=UPI001B57546C|nr:hypothetical protein [Bradyrhizobium japonicum]
MALAEFFDRNGNAVCYLHDDSHIFDWDGSPSGYIRNNVIYRYSGQVVGFLHRGWIYDVNGGAIAFSPGASGGPLKPLRKLKPLKALRKLKPLKGIRHATPVRPIFKLKWSDSEWSDL